MLSGDGTLLNRLNARGLGTVLVILAFHSPARAGPLLPPVQVGNVLKMTNVNVRLDYDLSTGRANFYWQNTLKSSGFYAGVGLYSREVLTNYITATVSLNRSWTVTNNQVEITLTRGDLPTMNKSLILIKTTSF